MFGWFKKSKEILIKEEKIKYEDLDYFLDDHLEDCVNRELARHQYNPLYKLANTQKIMLYSKYREKIKENMSKNVNFKLDHIDENINAVLIPDNKNIIVRYYKIEY